MAHGPDTTSTSSPSSSLSLKFHLSTLPLVTPSSHFKATTTPPPWGKINKRNYNQLLLLVAAELHRKMLMIVAVLVARHGIKELVVNMVATMSMVSILWLNEE
ncbi:hypothetical protein PIB30_013267 [Stylosanthes scabra]|uniref:Uncharacterized protein n=1 Tax=Stylosanthes scabra TaxID=79078 RepID=A0ABU6R5D7_9FABA|nr:hypothetical protein [Stylosanthes scabra]